MDFIVHTSNGQNVRVTGCSEGSALEINRKLGEVFGHVPRYHSAVLAEKGDTADVEPAKAKGKGRGRGK